MKSHILCRRIYVWLLTIACLVTMSAQAQVLYTNVHVYWDGNLLGSTWDKIFRVKASGNATCIYSISAGTNANAGVSARDRGVSGGGPGTTVFESFVVGVNSYSRSGSFAVTSNHLYELEASVGYSGSGVDGGGSAVANFFMPSSYFGVLPTLWQHGDVGSVAVPGSAGFEANIFTIQASGSGITNQSDSFHFIYQTLAGNGQIIACVTGVENTDPFAEGGVMVRETLETNSPFAFMAIMPFSLAAFGWRTATNQNSGQTSPVALPTTNCWVKLVRSGNILSGYYSTNGVTWLQSSSLSIAMQQTVYIGLASTAKNNTTLNTTTFNQVQFSPSLPYTLSGNSLQFNWPTNFTLQSTTNLLASNSWSNVSFTPTVSNGQYTLAIYTTNAQHYFRLKQ
jgi:hypothetical protein